MQTKVVPTYNNNVVCEEGNPDLTIDQLSI